MPWCAGGSQCAKIVRTGPRSNGGIKNGGPGNGGDGRGLARCAENGGSAAGGHRGELIMLRAGAGAWGVGETRPRDSDAWGRAAGPWCDVPKPPTAGSGTRRQPMTAHCTVTGRATSRWFATASPDRHHTVPLFLRPATHPYRNGFHQPPRPGRGPVSQSVPPDARPQRSRRSPRIARARARVRRCPARRPPKSVGGRGARQELRSTRTGCPVAAPRSAASRMACAPSRPSAFRAALASSSAPAHWTVMVMGE